MPAKSAPKPGPVSTGDVEPVTDPASIEPAEPDPAPEGRDRTKPRMSEGTRQDILMYGKVEDPHNRGHFLTVDDLPQ